MTFWLLVPLALYRTVGVLAGWQMGRVLAA
jgi:hypothetical protein